MRQEIAALIDELLPDGEFVLAEQAEKLVAALSERMPDELAAWQHDLTLLAISDQLRDRLHDHRRNQRRIAEMAS